MVERSQNTTHQFLDELQASQTPAGFPIQRVATGAVYGLLLGGLYALVAGTIDVFLFRDLPLRVDWPAVWTSIITTGLGAAALAALTAWPAGSIRGIIAGAAAITVWRLVLAFVQLQASALPWLLVFLPALVLSLPIAAVLRWLTDRHTHNLERRGLAWLKAQAILLMVMLALGVVVGSWAQMPANAQEAVRQVHRMLGRTLAEPVGAALPSALTDVPDIRAHAGVGYHLNQRASLSGPRAVDVRVTFEDGYRLTCVVDPESSFVSCVEGGQFPGGLFQFDPNDQR